MTWKAMAVTAAVKHLGRPISFYPVMARALGIEESLLLSQLIYWTPRVKGSAEGWIYKSVAEIELETVLTYRQQTRAIGHLKELGLLEHRYDRAEHCLYFRIVPEKIDEFLGQGQPDKGEVSVEGEHVTKRRMLYDETEDAPGPEHVPKCRLASDKTADGMLRKVSSLEGTVITSCTTQEESPLSPPKEGFRATNRRAFSDLAVSMFESRYGQKPSWRASDYTQLARLLQLIPELSIQEFERRYAHLVGCRGSPYYEQKRGSLAYFCSHFDEFIEPINGNRNTNRAEERTRHNREAAQEFLRHAACAVDGGNR